MALSAEVELSAGVSATGQRIAALCTVTNGGASTVNVTNVVPTVSPTGSTSGAVPVAVGAINARFPVSVPAGESVSFAWTVTPLAPTGVSGLAAPGAFEYSVSALVYGSNGSLVAADAGEVNATDPYGQTSPD